MFHFRNENAPLMGAMEELFPKRTADGAPQDLVARKQERSISATKKPLSWGDGRAFLKKDADGATTTYVSNDSNVLQFFSNSV